jgi:ankyrin repeat protein
MKYLLLNAFLILSLLSICTYGQSKVEDQNNDKTQESSKAKADIALLEVIEKGNGDEFHSLLLANADVNAMYKSGMTALMIAVLSNRLEFLKELIVRGADVNASDEEGNTALIYAAMSAEVEMVEELLIAGADVKPKNKVGFTALKHVLDSPYSAWDDYQKVAELLRANGAEK